MSAPVVLLAGGTGGAKLARGMLDVVGARLTVIANTADDVEVYGAHVSPDPDLVLFWLADVIDDRGWGLRGDTFAVMDALGELGAEAWFRLGDRDLAIAIERTRALAGGARLTEALAALRAALGVPARVLPMSDDRVRTRVRVDAGWLDFQDFMIRHGARPAIRDVAFDGLDAARPTEEALAAIEDAAAIVVGPSNPIISIGPILGVPGMRDALLASRAPVVAVSPIVGGAVLKGPTEAFLRWAGLDASAASIATRYEGLLDGIVADEDVEGLPLLRTDTLMRDADDRRRLAAETLRFAAGLAR